MTTKQLEAIKELSQRGWSAKSIGDKLGFCESGIRYWKKKSGIPSARRRGTTQYTFYDRKGNVRAFGTAREIADQLGIKISSVYEMVSLAKRLGRRNAVREESLQEIRSEEKC